MPPGGFYARNTFDIEQVVEGLPWPLSAHELQTTDDQGGPTGLVNGQPHPSVWSVPGGEVTMTAINEMLEMHHAADGGQPEAADDMLDVFFEMADNSKDADDDRVSIPRGNYHAILRWVSRRASEIDGGSHGVM